MIKTAIHLIARASFALALAIPSLSFAQDTSGTVQTLGNNLQIQRSVKTSVFEILTNSAVAVTSDQPFSEISIANPNIADISTLSDRTIYVLGKKPGRTTLMLLGSDGEVMTVVDILVTPDITEFEQRLAQLLPDENIQAFTANDGIVLTGTVSSADHMQQALELASRYAPERISNLMTLESVGTEIDVAGIKQSLGELLPDEAIDVRAVNDGIVLSGSVSTRNSIERALRLAERYAPGRVSNLMISQEIPVAPDAAILAAKLQEILPGERIEVYAIGSTIVLSGTVSSDIRIAQAIELMKIFSPESDISNLMSVRETALCTVRTRRGAEIFEMPVPCGG